VGVTSGRSNAQGPSNTLDTGAACDRRSCRRVRQSTYVGKPRSRPLLRCWVVCQIISGSTRRTLVREHQAELWLYRLALPSLADSKVFTTSTLDGLLERSTVASAKTTTERDDRVGYRRTRNLAHGLCSGVGWASRTRSSAMRNAVQTANGCSPLWPL
jgi:hypothetical protein